MRLRNIFFLFLLFDFFMPSKLDAQDRIRFLNGKELECKVEGITDSSVWVIKERKGVLVKDYIYTDVYSVVFGDTAEIAIYVPDSTDPLAFTLEQMNHYVAGESFARRHYKAIPATVGGFVAGAGGGFLGFWGLIIPVSYDLIVGSYRPDPKSKKDDPLTEPLNDFFLLGYKDVVAKRKTLRIIASSFIGVVTIVVYTTINKTGI